MKQELIKGFTRKEDDTLKLNYDDIYNFINFIKCFTQEARTGNEKQYVYNELQELMKVAMFN